MNGSVLASNLELKRIPYSFFKRIIDFTLSLFLIIVLSPVMLIIAVAIKIDSNGPAIFRQARTGKNGKVFMVWKFRSMTASNDIKDKSCEDRYTTVGKFIRRTSLDELPQLFNILFGEMSFIGPRPWITDYYDNMNEIQKHRCDVLPGITGLAQAKGRNNISIFEKINYDLEYIDNYSLKEDIKIIFLTFKVVLAKAGVSAGKATIYKEIDDLKTQELSVKEIKMAEVDSVHSSAGF